MPDRRIPLVALALSALVPGLGQLYNKEATKGLVIIGSCLGLGLLIYWQSGLNRITFVLALLLVWISAIAEAYKSAQASGQPPDFYYRKAYVVSLLLLIGPFALPLLWQSPHFSRTARWTWTAIVSGAALLFILTPHLTSWALRQLSPE
jgi:TM2 domain-containing membrane protein YozV